MPFRNSSRGWITFLLILGLVIGGFGIAVEAFRWLLIVALVALVTGGLVGWSKRDLVSRS
jgi:hypothetical protein